jgi:hypothetical protein
MGKSYNNVIKLTEMFSGNHHLLAQAYHPMTIRFFILQSHYRSTLDFGNDALQGSEKALKRLWEAYENLLKMDAKSFPAVGTDQALEAQSLKLIAEFTEFMNDDLNTAKVLANMFELAPIINGIKGGQVKQDALSATTISLMQTQMKMWLEEVFGLQNPVNIDELSYLLLEELIAIRNAAKENKDYLLTDQLRNDLNKIGINLKDSNNYESDYEIINQKIIKDDYDFQKSVEIYTSSFQAVKIVNDRNRIHCVIYNLKTNQIHFKWSLDTKEFETILSSIIIYPDKLNQRTYRIDFGKKHKAWKTNRYKDTTKSILIQDLSSLIKQNI